MRTAPYAARLSSAPAEHLLSTSMLSCRSKAFQIMVPAPTATSDCIALNSAYASVNSSSVASSTKDAATETLASFPTHLAVLYGRSLKLEANLKRSFITFSFQARRPDAFNTGFNRIQPAPPCRVPPVRRVIENNDSTDVNWTNRVRASVCAFTLKVSRAPMWVRVVVLSTPPASISPASTSTVSRRAWASAGYASSTSG